MKSKKQIKLPKEGTKSKAKINQENSKHAEIRRQKKLAAKTNQISYAEAAKSRERLTIPKDSSLDIIFQAIDKKINDALSIAANKIAEYILAALSERISNLHDNRLFGLTNIRL